MGEIYLGKGELWDEEDLTVTKAFNASLVEKAREYHSYIMAGTGSGKSELLKILIHHEMTQKRAVVVIDAHTDLCEQVARWPAFSNSRKVVLVAPDLAADKVPVINPLEVPRGASPAFKEAMAERLGLTIGEICSGGGSADLSTRMETVATAAMRILLDLEAPTLLDLRRMLEEETPPDLMQLGLTHRSAEVRDLFKSDWNSADYRSSKNAMRQRLRRLLIQTPFRAMTCGRSTVPFYDMVEDGYTILFSLGSAGSTTASAMGKLLVAMATIVGTRRLTVPESQRKPLHLFMDECQNFMGPSTVTVLEELRKLKVFLTMANQSIERLPSDVQTGILANAGVVVLGSGSPSNAMLRKMKVTHEIVQKLQPRKFVVAWSGYRPFFLYPRSDIVNLHQSIDALSWMEFKAFQRRKYYVAPLPEEGPEQPDKAGSGEWGEEVDVDI